MTRLGLPEIAILTWLVDNQNGTISEIGEACGIALVSARGRLSMLQKHKFVIGTPNDAVPPSRMYAITDEGRCKVER